MRPIDADALKELFSEVIGRIAKKPEMNGNLEHMIRASAMVIQMIDDAPTVQPDTTTHDSIPAETGKNDGDGTSGDCISRQRSVDTLRKMQTYKLFAGDDMLLINQAEAQTELMMLPPAEPEIIHCNSCKYWTQSTGKMKGYGLGRCDFHDADLVTCNGFCYWAERRNDG